MAAVLLLSEDDVRQLLTMEMALQAVEDGLRKLALDEAVNIPRARSQTDHALLHVMSGAAKTLGVMSYKAYSTSEENRRRFAQEMQPVCGCEIEPVPRPEMAAQDKDIIITATSSREPVLNGNWIAEGTHLNVIGSNFLGKAEVDAVAVRRCESIIVDSKDQARLEAGDFVQALEEGSIHWADVHELGQVIVGLFTGRAHPQDVTLFKSLGIAIEDVAVAARVYTKAQSAGLGKKIDW